ncbi:hypothetical protein ABEB22_15165 (plasmid) [Thioclava sp. 'Guangxiensis']|uniref:hypothetical protein n=1 Tax=Thioclava sp. 'Guangxiensis' TaxID=3149044 RepID=UPI0032C4A339
MTQRTYIGATVEVAEGKPATLDAAGFGALTGFSEVGEITEFGEIGDTSEDTTETTLKGRTLHVNGALDGGTCDFTFLLTGETDAGQEILKAKSNTNEDVSVKITDPDGEVIYFHTKVANIRDRSRTASTAKGMTGQFRINSALVRVAAA